jgi:hypothetical protein
MKSPERELGGVQSGTQELRKGIKSRLPPEFVSSKFSNSTVTKSRPPRIAAPSYPTERSASRLPPRGFWFCVNPLAEYDAANALA